MSVCFLQAQAGVRVHHVFVIVLMVIVPWGVRAQFLLVFIEICESSPPSLTLISSENIFWNIEWQWSG